MKKLFFLLVLLTIYFKIGYSQSGGVDSSFGKNGTVQSDFPVTAKTYAAQGRQVFKQPGGPIYVFIRTLQGDNRGFTSVVPVITRLFDDGSTDVSYGNNGYAFVILPSSSVAVALSFILAGAEYFTML